MDDKQLKSICRKCSNIPCRNGDYFKDSPIMISTQFRKVFEQSKDKKIYITECSGFNKALNNPKEN